MEGRLRTRAWEGQDGQKRSRVEIVADRVLFLDRQGTAPLPEEAKGGAEEAKGGDDLAAEDLPF